MPEDKKEVIKKTDSASYFKNMGINININKNTFSREDAIKVFEQAAKDLKDKAESDKKIRLYIGYAWNILQVGIKLL